MAIDDNTTYGLTGAQVKDLIKRISGIVFYVGFDQQTGDPDWSTFYTDSARTTAITADDVQAAFTAGSFYLSYRENSANAFDTLCLAVSKMDEENGTYCFDCFCYGDGRPPIVKIFAIAIDTAQTPIYISVYEADLSSKEVTYILTDKCGDVDPSYQMAMQRLMYEDYDAYNVYRGELRGTWNGSPSSGCLAFASADRGEYLPKNVVTNAFASGKTVHIITDLNNYTNSNLVVNGSMLAALPGGTEKATIAFQHTNVYNAAGIVAIEPRMSAGPDYWVYAGTMS
jgi:hypothetical protein